MDDSISGRFLLEILEHVAHPIFVKDRQFRFVFLNRALCQMVGIAKEAMLGKTDYDFFPQEQADWFRQKDTEMFDSGSVVDIAEERITDAAGQVHVLATTKVPLRDAEGKVTHLVGIIHDITELHQARQALRQHADDLEHRLQERTRELRQADRLKDEFLSVASHELRTPLGSLQLLLGALKMHLRESPQAPVLMPLLERGKRLISRLNRLVGDMLDMSRIQQGKLSVHTRPVELGPILREAVERARATSGGRHPISLEHSDEVLVRADPDRLDQVFSNLLANAGKYAPEGSAIVVSSRVVENGGGFAEVRVEDSGPGIPEELHERIFERFYQVEAMSGRVFGGLGLGLYISRELMHAQGGHIFVRSRPGQGSSFHVRIPLATPASPSSPEDA